MVINFNDIHGHLILMIFMVFNFNDIHGHLMTLFYIHGIHNLNL